jgi:hypothetical protein
MVAYQHHHPSEARRILQEALRWRQPMKPVIFVTSQSNDIDGDVADLARDDLMGTD